MSLHRGNSSFRSDNRTLGHKIASHGGALYGTAAAAPALVSLTAPYAVEMFTRLYGEEAAEPAYIGHAVFVTVLTFFGLERSFSLMLTLIAVSAARYAWLIGA